ncbi:MAG: hypothetical protein ABIB11_06300, partial [Candidatus Omnitrophota bacterium]
MINERYRVMRRVLLVLDLAVILSVFYLSYIIRNYFSGIYKFDFFPAIHIVKPPLLNAYQYSGMCFFILLIWGVSLSLNGMYRYMRFKSNLKIAWIVIKAAFFVTLAFGTFAFLLRLQFVSRFFFFIFMFLVFAAIFLEKLAVYAILKRTYWRGYDQIRLLVVGTCERSVHLMDMIKKHPEW